MADSGATVNRRGKPTETLGIVYLIVKRVAGSEGKRA